MGGSVDLCSPQKVLLMDEISTGLDSSTTFTIIQNIANIVHMQQVRKRVGPFVSVSCKALCDHRCHRS